MALPTTGACCAKFGPCNRVGNCPCEVVTREDCAAKVGDWWFSEGCDCENNQGACRLGYDLTDRNRKGPCCKSIQRNARGDDDRHIYDCVPYPNYVVYGTVCEWNTYSGCVDNGGVWLGDGDAFNAPRVCCESFTDPQEDTHTRMCPLPTGPNPPALGRCCHASPIDEEIVCCDAFLESECNSLNGDWDSGGYCWTGDIRFPIMYDCPPAGACCLGEVCLMRTEIKCENMGGRWRGQTTCVGVNCHIDIPDDDVGCRSALIDYDIPGLERSLNLCHPVLMGMVMRLDGSGGGMLEPISLHPIRAVEPNYSTDSEEPCRRHIGGVVLGGGGFFHPYVLSQTLNNAPNSVEMSIGSLVVIPEGLVGEVGMFAFLATYHTPFWTEARMHSEERRCIIPV